MLTQPPIIKTPEEFVPEYDFSNSVIKKKDVPIFFRSIFKDPFIPNEEREKFVQEFLIDYINDEEFREEYDGKWLLFVDRKWKGVIDHEGEAINYGKQKNRKYIIPIGFRKSVSSSYIVTSVNNGCDTRIVDNQETY